MLGKSLVSIFSKFHSIFTNHIYLLVDLTKSFLVPTTTVAYQDLEMVVIEPVYPPVWVRRGHIIYRKLKQ